MFVYVKVYNQGADTVVLAACDEELLGRVLREGDVILDISEEFFGGRKIHVDDVIELLEEVSSAILIGERVISRAINSGFVHPDAVLKVGNIPYAYIVKI